MTYHGVGVDVPADWTVEPWRPNCGFSVPTVIIGPEHPSLLFCPAFNAGGAEVVLGSLPPPGTPSAESETINGLTARVVSDTVTDQCGGHSATFNEVWVTLPTKNFTISISVADSPVCPGGGPETGPQIKGSIHAV